MSVIMYYKYCSVPLCENNTKNTPDKLFIPVPHDKNMRKKWMQLARRDWKDQSIKSMIYFCEDHFNLPIDMENFIQYKIQGYIKKIRMRNGCLPSKFACQPDRKRTAPSIDRSVIVKKQRKTLVEEALRDASNKEIECNIKDSTETHDQDIATPSEISSTSQHKFVQANIYHKYRSKGIQCKFATVNTAVSPVKISTKNVLTSPIKKGKQITLRATKTTKRLFSSEEERSESEISSPIKTPELLTGSEQSQSSESSLKQEILKIQSENEKQEILLKTIKKIKRRPRFYIGVPDHCYFLIDIIQKEHNIPEEYLLLCLKKIRLGTTFTELGDDFGMTWSYASKIFRKTIPIIANSLHCFIIILDEHTKKSIKLNLPIAFRHRYHSVSCIIDCMEIEIQKPSKALNQALTWSEYKKANTLKYLISCTPDGLINYISSGYTGRISDVQLVEDCGFLNLVPSGGYILADRGFKHLEPLLQQKGLQLLRPPSVPSGEKLTKQQVTLTKQIASIRIHIERVIRRVREFAMLKLHSTLHTNLLPVIDDILIIACALVNLQDNLIQ